ncbi:hypothetical protein BYZ73_18905 [Rhodovulum viride]|uniref:Uncharacterized protein n=1 Tax=Rhodovulum viride TaxID=1231134 RepID=A0ABX9DBQ8_9RHOB|nr:hypothetical protein [Rhodovulum viride]RAP39760.1 hypothetical protein BYZ73_18905 [Rhodovulum viride]
MADETTAPDTEPEWILKFTLRGGDTVEWIAAKAAVLGVLEELQKHESEFGKVGWLHFPRGAVNMTEVQAVTTSPKPSETKPASRARIIWC